MRPILVRDVETRSLVDVGDVGAHVYAAHPSTKVLCVGYCLDNQPVKIWRPGQPVPKEFSYALRHKEYGFGAHGAAFELEIERNILVPKYGFPTLPVERNICTMAISHALSLPGGLEKIAKVLNLDHMKDSVGHKVMLQMSKPRRARKAEDQEQVHWYTDDERMGKLEAYCMDDVAATREILDTLPELSEQEYQVWLLDQKINNHGIYLDRKLLLAAKQIIEVALPSFDQELTRLTNGQVTAITEVAKLKTWINQFHPIDTIRKGDLEELLQGELPDNVRRALELRQQGAHAAIKKVYSLLDRRDADGRVRGAFIYHAAGTGRWSSRGAQIHNLKRPLTKDIEAAIKIVSTGDYTQVRKAYPNPLSVIGDLIRATIAAAPGNVLIGADFSGIEARVTAWCAGEESKLDVFRAYDAGKGPDPYVISAAAIDNLEPLKLYEDFKSGSPEARESRQRGKASELAFGFAGGVGAYRRFAPDTTLTDEEIERIKNRWRRKHPHIVQLWAALNMSAWRVAHDHSKVVTVLDRLTFECDDQPIMWITLPSGRKLAYPHARVGNFYKHPGGVVTESLKKNMWATSSAVGFKDASAGQWRDVLVWPGILVENIVQAISRDLLSEAMLRVDKAGFAIVAHVHDECVIEVAKKDAARVLPEFKRLMNVVPKWAVGLPIVAKPWQAARYVK